MSLAAMLQLFDFHILIKKREIDAKNRNVRYYAHALENEIRINVKAISSIKLFYNKRI